MKKIYFLMIAICLVFSNSCKKDDKFVSIIDPDFQEYVDRFVTEADLRNITIDVSKLKVRYSDTLTHYCGYSAPSDVVIDKSCWENNTNVIRELLLFHELGHAILGRGHDNSKLPNGDFKSVMSTPFVFLYTESTPERRKYYLDELFIPSTPPPDWAAIKTRSTLIFKDTIQAGSSLWQFLSNPSNGFKGNFCSTQYFSEGTSLSIESYNLEGFSNWSYVYAPQGINQSDRLMVSARIKTVGVTKGGGVTLYMRGVDVNNITMFWTCKTDSGTMDFTEWKAEIPYYFPVKSIKILFVMDRCQGIAYLDDVTLTKFE
jgi:hypothetical protein